MENDLTLNIRSKGADEAADKLKNLKEKISDSGKTTSDFSDKLGKAAVAIAAVSAGLTAFSKGATDSTVQYVKSVQNISRITGESIDQTSRLQYVFQRSGISADEAATVFGTFSKRIIDANDATGEAALKTAELQNKIEGARIKISELTKEQLDNGDSSGELKNKIQDLNLSMQGYEKQIKETSSPLYDLGVKTQDADGKTRSFNEILLDVADKFKAMPDGAEKSATALELFGRNGKDLIGTLSKGSDGITELMKKADELGFTITDKNLEAVLNYTESQKKLKDAQQELTISIGNTALPMWQKLADFQVAVAGAFKDLPDPIKNVAGGLVAFGGPALAAVGAAAGLAANITQLSGKSIPLLLGKIPVLGGLLSTLAGSFGSLGSLLANPITLAILAVVGVIVLLMTHFKLWQPLIDGIKDAFQKFWSVLMVNLRPALQNIKDAFGDLVVSLQPLMPVFEFIAKVILGVLIVAFQGFIEIIAIVITVVVNMVAVIIYTISGFAAFFAAIWELIKAIFSGSWQNIVDAAKGFMNMFIGQFQRSYEILGVIGDALAGVGRLIASGIKQFLDTIAGFVGQFSDSGRKLVEAFADGIGQSFDKAKDKVRDGLDSIRRMLPFSDAKEGPLSTLTLSGRRFSETFASGIRKGAVAIQTAASDALGGLGGGVITSTVSGAPTAVPAALERTGAINSQAPNIDIHIGTLIGGDDASMRSLAVQLAQMVDQALKGQGVDKVTGLRPS